MAITAQETKIGLDSHCLSYLLDAIDGIEEPTDSLSDERKALLRIWLYSRETFYVSETVMNEVARIRSVERRSLHEHFVKIHLQAPPMHNPPTVEARLTELRSSHPGVNDCRVLAEAEDLQLAILLTYDWDFKRHLEFASSIVKVMAPSIYWSTLGIPKGAQPITAPHRTNPLSRQSWWRW